MAAFTALAFVFAGLVGFVHEATTTHVRCAEHGELIDSAIEVGGPAVAAPQRDSVVHALETMQGHDHCMLVSASRAVTLDAPPVVLTQIPFCATALAVAIAVNDRLRDALYRTAPKTSPPV